MSAELDAIKARLESATPGPWSKHDFGHPGQEEPSSIIVHAGKFDWQAINEGEFVASMPAWDSQEDSDAEFIANAPTDIARLLAAVEAVAALADGWENKAGLESEAHRVFGKQVLSVEFAVERIRAAIKGGDA